MDNTNYVRSPDNLAMNVTNSYGWVARCIESEKLRQHGHACFKENGFFIAKQRQRVDWPMVSFEQFKFFNFPCNFLQQTNQR